MAGDSTHGLVRGATLQQLGDGLMTELCRRNPAQSAGAANGTKRGSNEVGAGRPFRDISSILKAMSNEIMLRLNRASLPCQSKKPANSGKSGIVQRYCSYPVLVFGFL